jgi:hypothetical protein
MRRPRHRIWPVALAIALASPAGAAAGPPVDPAHPELSPRLAELATPALRNSTPGEQAREVGLPPRGPMSLVRNGDRVVVELRFERAAAGALGELRAAGARIEHVSTRYQTVTAAVDPADLRAVADVPRVASAVEALSPIVGQAGAGDDQPVPGVACPVGDATSEGDAQLRAGELRAGLGVDGTGVKVGVLSDSYDVAAGASKHAADDVASGDLPGAANPCGHATPVQIVSENAAGTDEGRAMLQIVHDLAPGAALAFAHAPASITGFADNVRALRTAGANVITDDITYFAEPVFQPGPIDVAVDEVTAAGIPYFAHAQNMNIRSGTENISSWESPAFRDAAACPAAIAGASTQCEDFDPDPVAVDNTRRVEVAEDSTARISLQWAEPWSGVQTDLDLYALRASDGLLLTGVTGAQANVTGSQRPFESILIDNDPSAGALEVDLVVARFSGAGGGGTATPRLRLQFLLNGRQNTVPTEYTTSAGGDIVGPAIFGHAGAKSAITSGAVPFTDGNVLEFFSSRGPVTHYFGPVTGTTPAEPLAAPDVISKPDIVATNGGLTTFFGGGNRFFGTSAAAPHSAAVGALQLDADPALTPAQVRSLQVASGRPVGAFGPLEAGAGLLDAVAAAPPPVVTAASPGALTNDATPEFTFSASHTATFTCSVDGAVAQACTSPFAPAVGDGAHEVTVTAANAFGKSGTATASTTVDATAPVATVSSGPRGPTKNARPAFAFAANETPVGFECSFDAAPFGPCSGAANHQPATALADGPHAFAVRATDAATNTSVPAERAFRVDTRKPRVTIKKHPPRRTRKRRARFTYRANEGGVKFECKLDGGSFAACARSKRVRVSSGRRHEFTVRGTDAAGNRGKKSFGWRVTG